MNSKRDRLPVTVYVVGFAIFVGLLVSAYHHMTGRVAYSVQSMKRYVAETYPNVREPRIMCTKKNELMRTEECTAQGTLPKGGKLSIVAECPSERTNLLAEPKCVERSEASTKFI